MTDRTSQRRRRIDGFALFWGAPSFLWQGVFFLAPLIVLVAMSFWVVRNFRLTPDFVFGNWERMLTRDYFWAGYGYTFQLALLVALLASLIAFPVAHYLAFRARPGIRRLAIFLLITPFFTSYLVRIYSWKIILSTEGVLNVMFGWLGLGPFGMIDNAFGAVVGYLTLCLPLVIIIQVFALSAVGRALIGAAHNLGAPPLRTTLTVTIPAARIGLILAATFAFILSFGDYVSPTYLGGGTPPTMSILVVDQTKSGNHWPRASVVAVTMVLTLVTVLFAALFAAYGRPGKKT
ncbi:MAG: ABC transporter permease [Paracoccaceae bacterium]|nr:ABC transporter permease [Paracoccaceae bacterium]